MSAWPILHWHNNPNSTGIVVPINKSLASSSLADAIDRILDKGVVIDAFVRIALVGIELIAIEARIVTASVETYLRYAEAVGLTTDMLAAAN